MAGEIKIIYKNVDDLIPYASNPRINDLAVDAVAASIREFGFKVPVIIDKDNEIVAGHTRIKAAKMLGMKEVPTIVADDLSDEQVKAFRIADNKVGELSFWEGDLLDMELSMIDMDMGQFGFEELEALEEQVIELQERDLIPYTKAHYLITVDINYHDEIIDIIKSLEGKRGVEIVSTSN